jgi:DNA repair protein RecO (recombination protein O)
MPDYEAEAIVLRQYSLSDSDRIVVFITREFGKIRAVAQGVKKPRSRISGNLEPLNHIRLVFWTREGRELSQVRQAELIQSFLGKEPDFKKMSAFSYFAELANELVQDNQPNYPLFRLLLASLQVGKSQHIDESLIRYYEIWCLKLSGLLPDYAYCSNCGKCVKDDRFFAWIQAGQARCPDCAAGQGLEISATASLALDAMMKLAPVQFVKEPITSDATHDLERLSQELLGMHLERKIKSYRILKEALQDE